MSRMKSLAVAALGAGMGLAASAARVLTGTTTSQVVEPKDRRERRRQRNAQRRRPSKTLYRGRHRAWSRYEPHQGAQEIARRARQIAAGTLQISGGARV